LLLWGGALAALARIGLHDEVHAAGAPVERLQVWSSTGPLLAELGGEGATRLPGLALPGPVLVDILRRACADVPVAIGQRLLGYGEDERGVELEFAGGGVVRAPIVIGADGVASAVRAQCLDDGPPEHSGDSVWEGITTLPGALPFGTLHLTWARDSLRGGAVALDRAGTTAWWVELGTGASMAFDPTPTKAELRELLAEVRGPLPALMEATAESEIHRSDVLARRHGPVVAGHGRAALIGDAAHPLPITLRMGGSLAIEDAVALAEALGTRAGVNVLEALRAYERQRAARVDWTRETLWRLRAVEAHVNPVTARAVDVGAGHLPSNFVKRVVARLLSDSPARGVVH
jgi:2-polyprenyl-6-methoxyphenol hydroxylase-like FAD-dependent oxidoreductase